MLSEFLVCSYEVKKTNNLHLCTSLVLQLTIFITDLFTKTERCPFKSLKSVLHFQVMFSQIFKIQSYLYSYGFVSTAISNWFVFDQLIVSGPTPHASSPSVYHEGDNVQNHYATLLHQSHHLFKQRSMNRITT